MKKARAVFLILILFELLMLSGCWNYTEINDLAIVNGIAIDKSKDGRGYSVTVEIVDLRGAGKEAKIQSKKIEAKGETFQDALRNVIKVSAKKLYYSHTDVVIISGDVARNGIMPVIDLILRSYQARLSLNILVSKVPTARELLSQQSITTEIRSIEMKEMIDSELSVLSKAPHCDVRNLINDLAGEGISLTLPMVGVEMNEGRLTSELSGTAVFSRDKMVGMLNEEDTKFMLFIKNKVKGGVLLTNENLNRSGDNITLDIQDNKTKVAPVYREGKLVMNIDVAAKAGLSELGVEENDIDENGRKKLEAEFEEMMKTNIENVINKVQKEYDVDIFGFGSIVKRKMPSLWEKLEPDWRDTFRDLPVNVSVKVDIKDSGLSSRPVKIGD